MAVEATWNDITYQAAQKIVAGLTVTLSANALVGIKGTDGATIVSGANPLPISGTLTAQTAANATAAAPSYSEGTENPLSQNLTGDLRVIAKLASTALTGVKGLDGVNIASLANAEPIQEAAPAGTAATATIGNAASLSNAIAIPAGTVVRGIQTPAAWTAAALTFDVSTDSGATYNSLRNPDGTEFSIATVGLSTFIPMPTFTTATNIKLRSGTVGTPVNQGGSRAFSVITG